MQRRLITLVMLGLVLALVGHQPVAAGALALVSVHGIVSQARHRPSLISFNLIGATVSFQVRNVAQVEHEEIAEALASSRDTDQSLIVRVDPDQGAFLKGGAGPAFVVREIVYRGKVIDANSVSQLTIPIEETDPSLSPATARALAKGGLLQRTDDQDGAIQALDLALSDLSLKPAYRGVALRIRGLAMTARVMHAQPGPSPEADHDLVRALADFDAASALTRPDIELRSATLVRLGAYDEALAGYEAAARQNPDREFWPLINIAAIQRARGDYDAALSTLDQIAKKHPALRGMAYYYNLGWTLIEAQRYKEAVSALTKGIYQQQDYAFAYFRRSCAQSRLGNLTEAQRDFETGRRFMGSLVTDSSGAVPVGESAPSRLYDQRWSERVAIKLKAAVAAGAPNDDACHGFWSGWTEKRERSTSLAAPVRPGPASQAATPAP